MKIKQIILDKGKRLIDTLLTYLKFLWHLVAYWKFLILLWLSSIIGGFLITILIAIYKGKTLEILLSDKIFYTFSISLMSTFLARVASKNYLDNRIEKKDKPFELNSIISYILIVLLIATIFLYFFNIECQKPVLSITLFLGFIIFLIDNYSHFASYYQKIKNGTLAKKGKSLKEFRGMEL
jgi:hypothetical protein